MLDLRRRQFLTLLGGAAAAWPVTALAQQSGRLIRLGVLGPTLNNPASTVPYEAFRTVLAEGGFREGQNLTIDYQSVDDPRGPFVVAAELTRSRPDLIVASGPEASLQAVMGVSGFIPVVMIAINFDPLARGYIASLARPGGNITGARRPLTCRSSKPRSSSWSSTSGPPKRSASSFRRQSCCAPTR